MSQKLIQVANSLNFFARRLNVRFINCYHSQLNHKAIKNEAEKQMYKNIYARIKACGPISVADYMKEVLTHPLEGYYMSKDVIGPQGDFVTSPEISQLFGEMIGVWIINEWHKITDQPVQLVELGPGRGTLSNNILKICNHFKLEDKVSLHLVEISPKQSKLQAEKICVKYAEQTPQTNQDQKHAVTHYMKGVTKTGIDVYWYYSIKDVPKGFSIFLAHEFFDALPIHKFQRTKDGWCEVMVDIDLTKPDQERFRYVLAKTSTPAGQIYLNMAGDRNHFEVSPQALVIIEHMSNCISEDGGFAMIIDYGHDGANKDTFRAFKRHKQHDPLLQPGSADLTADVDFSTFKQVAVRDERLICLGPVQQNEFLRKMGIDVRLEILMKKASDSDKKILQRGYNMIMDETQMGACFKVLAMFPAILKDHFQKWPISGF